MKEANATIILINPKGLNENELNLICGRNKDFGKLKTKEIFLLVNKIGPIYDNNPNEKAEIKIQNIINQVNNELELNNVKDVKVFAIDGLDYLHAFDKELYNEFRESKKGGSYKVLSQNEYLERSRYEEFKKYLFEFLEKGNRQKAFEEDIKEKISILLEELEEGVLSNISIRNSTESFNKYDKEKELLIENRRRFINSLKREISSLSNEFMESINCEIGLFVKFYLKNGGELVKLIERQINGKNITDIENKVDKILENINELILQEVKDISNNMNLFYGNMKLLLNDKFNNDFKKAFKKTSNIKFNLVKQNVKINFKFNSAIYSKEYYEEISNITKEIDEKSGDLTDIDVESVKSNISQYEKDNSTLEQDLKRNKEYYYAKKSDLGIRPSPKQKYRTAIKTKRKWIFFKEEYTDEVPDGLDFSECSAWDENNEVLLKKYKKEQEKIDKRKDDCNKKIKYCEKQILMAKALNEEIMELKEIVKTLDYQAKENISKYKDRFIERKKNDIYILAKKYINDNENILKRKVEIVIDEQNSNIKKAVEEESINFLDAYESKIETDIQKIKEEISKKNVSDDELKFLINELKSSLE